MGDLGSPGASSILAGIIRGYRIMVIHSIPDRDISVRFSVTSPFNCLASVRVSTRVCEALRTSSSLVLGTNSMGV